MSILENAIKIAEAVVDGYRNPGKAFVNAIPMIAEDLQSLFGSGTAFRKHCTMLCEKYGMKMIHLDDKMVGVEARCGRHRYPVYMFHNGMLLTESRLRFRRVPAGLSGLLARLESKIPGGIIRVEDGVIRVGRQLPPGTNFGHAVGHLSGFTSALDDELEKEGF